GAHEGMALFDLSTDSPAMVRKFHAALAEKGCQAFDAPVSGGPEGARTGKLAIWCGGDRATYDRCKPILDSFGDQAAYIGPIGTATVAKLVHNMAGYAIGLATAEVFSMGVKAGMDPVDLWKAVRQGALGRRRTFDRVTDQFLVNKYDPPAFQLRLAHKDVSLAVGLGRELGVPMHICEYTLAEMTKALERPGWAAKDSRIPMTLQLERAGVTIQGDPARIKAILDAEKAG
ncbi:MAG: NAD-binding protein, partial [Acetobacteraceae bacterium]|nr:NAD-binding protein [Acetobacteraceae bacterium]